MHDQDRLIGLTLIARFDSELDSASAATNLRNLQLNIGSIRAEVVDS